MNLKVSISRELLEAILDDAKLMHPKEMILLLRGKTKGGILNIEELIIPPLATHGVGFAGFPMHMLPLDFSLIGTVHSHPSSSLQPSVTDLNKAFGKILMIVAFPYRSLRDVAVYNREGKRLDLLLK
jgi:proteasome lid subunit RPN8/RPN11